MKPGDLLVVETTTGIAGPLLSRPLADLGARVVKVESTARLDTNRRRVPPPGMTAEQLKDVINVHEMNAGKASVALNLKTEGGREGFLALIRQADVYVENFAPGWLSRVGLDHESMLELNPRLIVLAQSAYGERGPLSDRRAYAPVMTALAGVESVVGYDDGRIVPQMAGAVGDVVAAYYGLVAVLAALHERSTTGKGAIIDISQIEASACVAGVAFAEFGLTGTPPLPQGNIDPRYAPHGIYRTAGDDQWVALAVWSDDDWHALARALDLTEDDEARYAHVHARLDRRAEVDSLVEAAVLREPRDALFRRLQAAGVACAPVLDCYEAEALPEFVERELWTRMPHPTAGYLRITRVPWRFESIDLAPRGAFEGIGASTDRILTEIGGISREELERQRSEGAFA